METVVLVGLGNPGKKYERTRHNFGARVLRNYLGPAAIWKDAPAGLSGKKALITRVQFSDLLTLIGVLPLTYMNNSGAVVRGVMDYFKLQHPRLVVLHDDMDVALGQVRVQDGGSAHGHNGVRSVEAALATQDFLRVRLGVGRPSNPAGRPSEGALPADFVLENFSVDEEAVLAARMPEYLERVAEAVKK